MQDIDLLPYDVLLTCPCEYYLMVAFCATFWDSPHQTGPLNVLCTVDEKYTVQVQMFAINRVELQK